MSDIGILAAMTISVLGPASDVSYFFNAVTSLLEGGERGRVYPSVTERLYRRSLRMDGLLKVKADMDEIKSSFSDVLTSEVDLRSLGVDVENSCLILNGKTLADVFNRFFDGLADAVECTDIFLVNLKGMCL